MRFVILSLLALTLCVLLAASVSATCALETLAPDRDCDGITDGACVAITNGEEQEAACGLATSLTLIPGTIIEQGSVLTMRAVLINTLGAQNTGEVSITNEALGVDVTARYDLARDDHTTIEFIVPLACAEPGVETLTITTERHAEGVTHVQRSFQDVRVVDGSCVVGGRPSVLIETLHEQRVLAGETVRVPFRIVNLQSEAQTYRLTLDGLPGGTYRVEPAAEVTLPAGATQTGTLVLETETGVEPGEHTLLFSVGPERAPVTLRILQPVDDRLAPLLLRAVKVLLALIVLALIIATIILLYRHMRGENTKEEADFGRYY